MRLTRADMPVRSPYCQVWLQTKGQKDLELTDRIENFNFDEDVEEDDMLTITVKEDFILALVDDPRLVVGATLKFQFGYIGWRISDVRYGKIADIETTYAEHVSLEITAVDLGLAAKKTTSMKVWQNMTGSQIAYAIAAKYNLKTKIEDSTHVFTSLPQGNKPDFAFLKYVAELDSGGDYMAYYTGDELYYIRRKNNTASVVTYHYGVYEVVSFAPKWNEIPLDEAAQGATSIAVDDKTGKVVTAAADTPLDETLYTFANMATGVIKETASTAARKLLNPEEFKTASANVATPTDWVTEGSQYYKDLEAQVGRMLPMATSNPTELSNKAKTKKKKAKQRVLEAVLEVEGNPLIMPTDILTMKGVAKIHSGNWYVMGIEHDMGGGSAYISRIRLRKNSAKALVAGSTKSPDDADATKTKTLPNVDQNQYNLDNGTQIQ